MIVVLKQFCILELSTGSIELTLFILSSLTFQVKFVREYVSTSRCKVSFVAENLIDYTETFFEFDPMLVQPGPSNPWITDDQTHWLLNQPM